MAKTRYDIPVEPKAGKVGVLAVYVFGVASILATFVAAYMWTDADTRLAGAIAIASVLIPTGIGYFVSEVRNQRAGALWFVLTAAVIAGGMFAWALNEEPAFQDRMDLIAPSFDASN